MWLFCWLIHNTCRIFVKHNTVTTMKWKCVNFANTVLNLKLLALFVKQNNRNAIKFVCPCRKTLTFFDAFIPYFLCYVRCVLVQCANVKWTVSKIKLHAVRSIC